MLRTLRRLFGAKRVHPSDENAFRCVYCGYGKVTTARLVDGRGVVMDDAVACAACGRLCQVE